MTQEPAKKREDDETTDSESTTEDYINEKHPGEDREDAVVDEQIDESFPASDPPANY
ncbi:MAG TPA: hypothetical protein VIG71_10590 [Enteractinococcus sp.]